MEEIEVLKYKAKLRQKLWKSAEIYFFEACRQWARETGKNEFDLQSSIRQKSQDILIRCELAQIRIPECDINIHTKCLMTFISNELWRCWMNDTHKFECEYNLNDIDKRFIKKYFKKYGYRVKFKGNKIFVEKVVE